MERLLQGDCLDKFKEIEDNSIDMVLTDPPYGKTACEWDSVIDFNNMWDELKRIIKNNSAIVMTATQPFTTFLINSNIDMFRYCWIWFKNTTSGFQHSKRMPLRNYEDIVVFYNKQPTYNPIKEKRDQNEKSKNRLKYKFTTKKGNNITQKVKKIEYKPEDIELRYPTMVKKFNSVPTSNKFHPTQKPVELMEYLIKTYTNENDIILDFAMGSGTTGVACKKLNRDFIGIEKDQEIFNTAKKRINSVISREEISTFF